MAQRSKAPHIDNEQGLRCWTHLVGDGIDARTWSNTPSSSSHAEGIVLDCGHRTATRRIEECTIVDNCSFNVIGGVVELVGYSESDWAGDLRTAAPVKR